MTWLTRSLFIFLSASLCATAQSTNGVQIAFLADVHFQDLYGKLESSDFNGITNPANGKKTLLRTMESQLHSTRIFNENYFAFLAALDDIASRNIKIVALPGDYTDDGQPIHVRGLAKILDSYSEKFGIQFFITTGNHDPVGPFAQDAGKEDFLGKGGKMQPIYSKDGMRKNTAGELPTAITRDISKMGYAEITENLQNFGFYPKKENQYWATPFSTYSYGDYTFKKASAEASLDQRMYETAPGFVVPDVSYLVEPVPGIWLLAIDGNSYVPKNENGDTKDSNNYKGADLGYNNLLAYKKHLLPWVKKIVSEAKKQHKTLIAFSHYPMADFNDGASAAIESLMGSGKWQLNRVPSEEVVSAFADAGLKIHFGGHMHINDTGIFTSFSGNTLVNIQTPSLAAYVPAYKLLTIKSDTILEVETITIGQVPRFDELFELYKTESDFLEKAHPERLWDKNILRTKDYLEFTDWHLKELVRLRFIPEDWPADFATFLQKTSGYELLVMASLDSGISLENLKTNDGNWKKAVAKATAMLQKEKLKKEELEKWDGNDLIADFYRIRSGDDLTKKYIPVARIRQYALIANLFSESKAVDSSENPARKQLYLFFSILKKFMEGTPANHFEVHLDTGKVTEIKN